MSTAAPIVPLHRGANPPPSASAGLEASLLGGLLHGPDLLPKVAACISPDDFEGEAHRVLFATMLALRERGAFGGDHFALVHTLLAALGETGDLNRVGGPAYVTGLADAPGEAAVVERYAAAVAKIAQRRRVVAAMLDWQQDHRPAALAAVRSALDALERSEAGPASLPFISDTDMESRPPPPFLVDGVLVAGGLAVLYAPPGTGKTFLALDYALSIATGAYWQGRAVHGGFVVYVAAEGSGGLLGQRITAWKDRHQLGGPAPLVFLDRPVDLLNPASVRSFLAAVALLPHAPALVVFDTLARCMAGADENSTKDMSEIVASLDRIRTETGAAVLVVHHTNKGGQAMRGSTALQGAADTVLALSAPDGGGLQLKCEKQKDAPEFPPVALALVPSGPSMVVVGEAEAPRSDEPAGLSDKERTVLECLVLPGTDEGAAFSRLEKAAALPPSSFARVLRALATRGYARKVGEGRAARWWITNSGLLAIGRPIHPE